MYYNTVKRSGKPLLDAAEYTYKYNTGTGQSPYKKTKCTLHLPIPTPNINTSIVRESLHTLAMLQNIAQAMLTKLLASCPCI